MDTLTMQDVKSIIIHSLEQSFSPLAYDKLLQGFVANEKTSGVKQTEDLIHYTKLNAQRGKRISKTWRLNEALVEEIEKVKNPQKWMLITESWCGDAANAIPLIVKLASLNDQIDLRLVFRDENLDLMDQFSTNGGRSIPKLVALNQELDVLFTWGPRPAEAQELYMNWKNAADRTPYSDFQVILQKWYNQDAGKAMQEELLKLISS